MKGRQEYPNILWAALLRVRLRSGGVGFGDSWAGGWRVRGLRSLGRRGHGRVPVEEAAATVASEHLALAKLIPHLRPHTHAAASTLLVIHARQACATGAGETVEADEPLGVNQRAKNVALGVERGQLCGILPLANGNARTGILEGGGKRFDLRSRGGESRFLRFRALQAGELLIFKALGFRGREGDFVFDGFSLCRGLHGIKLGAEARRLLSMSGNFAIEAGAEGLFAIEQIGSDCRLTLGGFKRSFGLGSFARQTPQSERNATTLQIHCLQLYEIFNLRLHP